MNDIDLYFTESGTGFPLVLLHGNGESSDYFQKQIDYFKDYYRVIAVDTRGHGRSPRGNAPFTLDRFADDLKYFLDGIGVEKCHLLGFSDGANIALLFALKYPGYIDRLILNGADLFPSGVKPAVQLPIVIGYGIVSFISLFDRRAIPNKEILGLMVTQPDIRPEELKKLTVPSLVIVGTKDMIKDRHSRLIAASIPDSRFVRIEGDHFIAAKNSEAFNRAVEAFLK